MILSLSGVVNTSGIIIDRSDLCRNPVSAEQPFMLEWSRMSQEATSMWCQWTNGGSTAVVIRMGSPLRGNTFWKLGNALFQHQTQCITYQPCLHPNLPLLLSLLLPVYSTPQEEKPSECLPSSEKPNMTTSHPTNPAIINVQPIIVFIPTVNKAAFLLLTLKV